MRVNYGHKSDDNSGLYVFTKQKNVKSVVGLLRIIISFFSQIWLLLIPSLVPKKGQCVALCLHVLLKFDKKIIINLILK